MLRVLLILSCVISSLAQYPAGTCGSGKNTWYTEIDGGMCSFGAITGDKYIVALSEPLYNRGKECGSCYRVTGPKGSVIVTVTDLCPAAGNEQWCGGTHTHFDMSTYAFNLVADDNTDITYQRVSCPVSGSIDWVVKDGSNPYWFAILAKNHRMQLTSLEVSVGSGWHPLVRLDYNYWACKEPGNQDPCIPGGIPTPFSIRATSETGEVIVDRNVITSVNTGSTPVTFRGTVQFSQPEREAYCDGSFPSDDSSEGTPTRTIVGFVFGLAMLVPLL